MIEHRIAKGLIRWYMQSKGYSGWTSAWRSVYYIDGVAMSSPSLRRHELKHIEQIERDGRLLFMIKYIYYNIRYGYYSDKHFYEQEARDAE